MNSKKQIEKELIKHWNECLSLGLYISYRTVLDSAYETASERNQYFKCSFIQELISEDINQI